MTTQEIAMATGYAHSTVKKYAMILQVKYYGNGHHKVYDWSASDVARFQSAILGADGARDRRGETQKKLQKISKNVSDPLKIMRLYDYIIKRNLYASFFSIFYLIALS
jgi:hypothetical protein